MRGGSPRRRRPPRGHAVAAVVDHPQGSRPAGQPWETLTGSTWRGGAMMPVADEDADFSAFAAQAWAGLYRRAYLFTGQHADAEDLAQQTLIRTRRHWRKVVRAGSPDAYVTRILTNVYLSSRRR